MTKLDLYNVPENDQKTFDLLETGLSAGVFQMENPSIGPRVLTNIKPKSIDHLASCVTIIRPGVLNAKFDDDDSAYAHFIRRHNKEEEPLPPIPEVKDLLDNVYGIPIFQENALLLAKKLAGFDGPTAMKLQKGISKKKADVINELRPKFIEGCVQNGVLRENAEKLYDIIEKSNRYSFVRCVHEDTIVNTKFGGNAIKNIEIGEFVGSPDGYVEVIDVIDCGMVDCYEIVLDSDKKIVCGKNHRFLTNDGVHTISDIISRDLEILSMWGSHQILAWQNIGEKHCYDLEVDHPSHLYYQNGLVGHNSHAVSYAHLTYLTAYCKANFTIEFMVASLRMAHDKLDPKEEIQKIVRECAHLGIRVKPPTILKPCLTFTEFEGTIFCGISDIKGVGDGKAQELIECFPSPPQNWYEALCKMCHLSKTLVQNSIKSGVFSYLKVPRRKMLDDFSNIQMLSGGETKFVQANWSNYNNFGDLFQGVLGVAQTKRKPQVESIHQMIVKPAETLEDNLEDCIKYETEMLGVALSYDLIDTVQKLGNCTIYDYKSGAFKKELRIVAEIESVKPLVVKTGKNEGKAFAALKLKDQTGEMEAMIFSEAYDEIGGMMKPGLVHTFIGVRGKNFIVNAIEMKGGF